MRALLYLFFLAGSITFTVAQSLVEITIDSAGRKKTIRTNRPDTLFARGNFMKGMKEFKMPHSTFSDVPIYKSKADSLKLATAEMQLDGLGEGSTNIKKSDSLINLLKQLRSTSIIGYRKNYFPNKSFFPFDSLRYVTNTKAIIQMSVSNIRTRKIRKEILACTNLQVLEIVNTSIQKLPRSLKKLPDLKIIRVYNNRSKRSLKLGKNANIQTLTIRGDKPGSLPTNYAKFINLRKLDLADNTLTGFPKGAHKNKCLKEIILSGNKLTLLDDDIKTHLYLEKLDLGKNALTEIGASIRSFPSLKILKFNHNSITKVDAAIGSLKKLEQLSFYANQLKAFPSGVYELLALKEIDLYYNQIEKLDEQATYWQKLEVLYLAFNKLTSLPESLGKLQHLRELYLHNNRLSSLPEKIGNLQELRVLRINNNFLTVLPTSIYKLNGLENMDLSHNSLTEVPEGILNFDQLKILALVSNPWTDETKRRLADFAKELRQKNAIVHLNSFDENQQ